MPYDTKKASDRLIQTLSSKGALTVADASLASGLSMQDAEKALHQLVFEYRGHLSATEKGEILFRFPNGFTKPWEKVEAFDRFWRKTKKAALGVAKFVVRAWISIVMVAYVAIFAAILIGLSLSQKSDRDDRRSFGGTLLFHTLFRLILDSLFWTFHPFSPYRTGFGYHSQMNRRKQDDTPFYEKVNRFFFGPEEVEMGPLDQKKRVLAEIRSQKGRISLSDVIKVTGFDREKADPMLSQLLLEYDGDVSVSESGGIVYSFPELRRSATFEEARSPAPIWSEKKVLAPLTGNPGSTNWLIAGLNGFNLLMSLVAIENSWTIENLKHLFSGLPPVGGNAVFLGFVPFIFSSVLFALPLIRAMNRNRKEREVARENGRRGLLFVVLTRIAQQGFREESLRNAWKLSSGIEPTDKELTREILRLGGEAEISEEGVLLYRFKDLEADSKAVKEERSKARDEEAQVGEIAFSSEA